MHMKTKFSILVALMLISLSVIGQNKMDANKMAEYQTSLMKSELNLDKEQQDKVEELNIKYSKKMADLMNREGSMFGKMGEMKKIKKAKNGELEKILSDDQMELFEDELEPQIRKTMRKRMAEK